MGILRSFIVPLLLFLCSSSINAEIKSRSDFKDVDVEEGSVLTEEDFERPRNFKDPDDQDVNEWSSMENPEMHQCVTRMTEEEIMEWDRRLVSDLQSDNTQLFKSAAANRVRWPNGVVPYVIDEEFSEWDREAIDKAVQDFHENTCIKFVPRTDESNYIYIHDGGGCWSRLGMEGGRQLLSLGFWCLGKGTIVHELMHALGFVHEHCRPDRDQYVTILEQNIHENRRDQFTKYPLRSVKYLNTTYDYGSIMHYGKYQFSKNKSVPLPTIVPKKPGVTIGQRRGFSAADILRVNRLYNCPRLPTSPSTPVSVPTTNSNKQAMNNNTNTTTNNNINI